MENRYILERRGSHSKWRSSEEFQEEDVWGAFRTKVVRDSDSISSYSSDSRVERRLPTASRMIPKSGNNNNNHNHKNAADPRIIQQSAPVNIPDWSKIYRTSNSKPGSYSWLDPDSDEDDGGSRGETLGISGWESDDDDEEEDGEGNVIPPHEWVAKKLARSQISSFSVFEGAGRTLKGRDLSRVRNDVLTKTGFLE